MADEMKTADYIELGILYVREGRYQDAYKPLRQALTTYGEHNLQAVPPALLSYYGLCLIALEKDADRGLTFCRRAVDEAGHRTDLYWNLGKAYLLLNRKTPAIEVFERGLAIDDDPRLFNELVRLGLRSHPPIPFLPRGHFLNRCLGMLRARGQS